MPIFSKNKIPKTIIVDTDIRLIRTDPWRDARVSVEWLQGEQGRETLRAMGVVVADDFEPSAETELARLKSMLKSRNEIIRMIEYKGRIVGCLEIWTVQYDNVPSPSVSLLIGSPNIRGLGIGTKVVGAIEHILSENGFETINMRALLANEKSNNFFINNRFVKYGTPYTDENGLAWQVYSKLLVANSK